jgi:hypothetical protein
MGRQQTLTRHRYGLLLQRLKDDVPRGTLARARDVLAWVAFSKRPMKPLELLDGVTFTRPPYELSSSTKLFKTEIERCGPILEHDALGNVGFVHFSAKESAR